jgi:serine/threonine-protein phosphatase 2B regulatory subunit
MAAPNKSSNNLKASAGSGIKRSTPNNLAISNSTNFNPDEINRLYKRFMKVHFKILNLSPQLDKDNNGKLEKHEFLAVPQIASNPLAQRMIAIFDDDGSGTISTPFNPIHRRRGFLRVHDRLKRLLRQRLQRRQTKMYFPTFPNPLVAFKVYDIDRDGYISNGELFIVLKMMVGNNLRDAQLQQIVDKTVMEADTDKDGKISFDEFCRMVEGTDIIKQMTVDSSI